MKILVCDDDPVCLAVIRRKLEGEKDVEVVLAKGWLGSDAATFRGDTLIW